MQPPPPAPDPRLSADGRWWWDGVKWVPADQVPAPPPPPPSYWQTPATWPAPDVWNPSPGLRQFLIVMLILADVVTGFFALFGLLALADYVGLIGTDTTQGEPATLVLIVVFLIVFAVMVLATVGVVVRASWARVAAIIGGVLISLSCLGLVLGIPILVAAARAPLGKRPAV